MSKSERNLLKEVIADLDSIAGDKTAHERLAFQVGFLAAVLARIYEQDWILHNDWKRRINNFKERK